MNGLHVPDATRLKCERVSHVDQRRLLFHEVDIRLAAIHPYRRLNRKIGLVDIEDRLKQCW